METKTSVKELEERLEDTVERQLQDDTGETTEKVSFKKPPKKKSVFSGVKIILNKIAKTLYKYKEKHTRFASKMKEKWLRHIAKIDCVAIRWKHRATNFIAEMIKSVLYAVFSVRLLRIIGDFFYAMGFQTEYRLIRLGRTLKSISRFFAYHVFAQVLRVLRVIWREIVIIWHELFRPFFVFVRGIYHVFAHGKKVSKEKNIIIGVFSSIAYLFRGLFRYIHVLPGMISYVLPFIAAAGFMIVVQTTLAEQYTIAVHVDGQVIGYVANEMVFEDAKDNVQERVEYAGTTATSWDISPTYTLSTETAVLTEEEMTDAILFAASDEISEATAVYIDGALCLVTDGGDELQAYLDSLTAPYEDPENKNLTVSFNKEITLSDGLYFTEGFTSASEIIEYFSGLEAAQINYTIVAGDSWSLIASKNGMTQAEIFAMNPGMSTSTAIYPGEEIIVGLEKPVLQVLIYQTIEYDEAIPYSTVKTESSDYNFGTTQVTQYGADGVRHITAEIVTDTSGNTLNTEILSNVVTLEPVEQVEVVGTYLPSGMIAQVGSGSFIWPVPNYRYVSRWAHSSHKGVDICAPAGTPIYAVDSGVVIKAGYNAAGTGYGYSVVIDHGNGYTTLYAHGLSVAVSVGQAVSQGDYIMPMGSTGRSTGNHLHFEIKHYGSLVWPQNIYSQSYY